MKKGHLFTYFSLLVVLFIGCGNVPPSQTANLRVAFANHPWTESLKKYLPDFEQDTGIKVNVEIYEENKLNEKITTEFVAGSSTIDIFMHRPLLNGRASVNQGWHEDLFPYIKKASEWDFNDFHKSALEAETINSIFAGIPLIMEREVLYYRKDLFQKAGLGVPATLDELYIAASKMTNKSKEEYGFISRGAGAMIPFSGFLHNRGGSWFNKETHQATLNTPQAIKAFQEYGELLREYGPPGVLSMGWPQTVAAFSTENIAMYTDADAFLSTLLNKNTSRFADQIGIAPFPNGEKEISSEMCSWGLAMYADSQQKQAAWKFIQWASSKEMALKTQGEGGVPSARLSPYTNPQGTIAFPRDFMQIIQKSKHKEYSVPVPPISQVLEAREIISGLISDAIEGKDVKIATQEANVKFQQILDEEKK